MTYSFIQPRKKPILSLFDKIWLIFFIFSIFLIFIVYFLYLIKTALIYNFIEDERRQIIQIQEQVEQNEGLYNLFLEQSQIANALRDENQIFKNGLKNLFDIVLTSDGISLESVEQERTSLKLIGITPTMEVFALLLETPLKSIFDQSFTTYYRLNNGWYRFVSINKIEEF